MLDHFSPFEICSPYSVFIYGEASSLLPFLSDDLVFSFEPLLNKQTDWSLNAMVEDIPWVMKTARMENIWLWQWACVLLWRYRSAHSPTYSNGQLLKHSNRKMATKYKRLNIETYSVQHIALRLRCIEPHRHDEIYIILSCIEWQCAWKAGLNIM